jgi:molybdopterin adenylyltransferase
VRVAVITISDRASRGVYGDLSGPEIERLLLDRYPQAAVSRRLVSDERDAIRAALEAEAAAGADIILTTGGTGLSPRDVTPEATSAFCDREAPGIAEALRAQSSAETPAAMLSRGFAGLRGSCLVVNFPGSPKAVRRCMEVLGPVLEHAMAMIRGEGHP